MQKIEKKKKEQNTERKVKINQPSSVLRASWKVPWKCVSQGSMLPTSQSLGTQSYGSDTSYDSEIPARTLQGPQSAQETALDRHECVHGALLPKDGESTVTTYLDIEV